MRLQENSIKPHERYTYVQERMKELAGGDSARFLEQFGVRINIPSNEVIIKQRRTPQVEYGGSQLVKPRADGAWYMDAMARRFIAPSNRLKRWIVVYDTAIPVNAIR